MTNENFVFFSSKAVKDFLVNFGRGPNSKDYEFMCALALKNFCEKQWGVACEIGFEIKDKFFHKMPKASSVTLNQVASVFREQLKIDTLTDCAIATEKMPRTGLKFQIKRFGIGREKKGTQELMSFINSLNNVKTKEGLFIMLDNGVELELPKVREEILKNEKFPFSRLMFGWMENGKICIGEIYPQYGMEEYDIEDFTD